MLEKSSARAKRRTVCCAEAQSAVSETGISVVPALLTVLNGVAIFLPSPSCLFPLHSQFPCHPSGVSLRAVPCPDFQLALAFSIRHIFFGIEQGEMRTHDFAGLVPFQALGGRRPRHDVPAQVQRQNCVLFDIVDEELQQFRRCFRGKALYVPFILNGCFHFWTHDSFPPFQFNSSFLTPYERTHASRAIFETSRNLRCHFWCRLDRTRLTDSRRASAPRMTTNTAPLLEGEYAAS